MAQPSTLLDPITPPVQVNGELTEMEGKRGSELELDAQKDDSKNQAHIEQQTVREDQVQNAVKFLSHPSVRGSPIVHRRSFLETKGLSKEEIEEAFRRIPDPSSNKTVGAVVITDGKRFIQGQQNVAAPISSEVVPVVPLPVIQAQSRPYWSQIVFALGFLAASGTGAGFLFKRFLLQKFKSWIRWVVLEDNASAFAFATYTNSTKEVGMAAAIAAKSASAAAAEVADASREMIKMQSEERHYLSAVIRALEVHTLELTKAMTAMKVAIEAVDKSRQLVAPKNMSLVQSNGKWRVMEEGKAMGGIQNTQKVLNPAVTSNGLHSQNDVATNNEDTVGPSEMTAPECAPHSASYLKVMAMLERGETPPGIQEVNDKPPNPDQPPSVSRLKPRPKPWQTVRTGNWDNPNAKVYNSRVVADNAMKSNPAIDNQRQEDDASLVEQNGTSLVNSDSGKGFVSTVQWQRQKKEAESYSFTHDPTVKPTEIEVISECEGTSLENSSGGRGEGCSSTSVNEQISGPSWVPPPIPKTVMPGAAAAIKYQKAEQRDDMKLSSSPQESAQIPLHAEVEDIVLPASSQAVADLPPQVVQTVVESETEVISGTTDCDGEDGDRNRNDEGDGNEEHGKERPTSEQASFEVAKPEVD